MAPQSTMKTLLLLLAALPLLAADEPKSGTLPAYDAPSYLLDSTNETGRLIHFDTPVYNDVTLPGMRIKGKSDTHGQSITIADQGVFTPADTVITVRWQPFIKKRGDEWVITFNAKASEGFVTWQEQPYTVNGVIGRMGVRSDGVMVWEKVKP